MVAKRGTASFRILNALAIVGTYITGDEIVILSAISRLHTFNMLKSLEVQEYVEKVLRAGGGKQYYYRITDSGRHEHSKLKQIHGQIEIADAELINDIESRNIVTRPCRSIIRNREQEAEIRESFKIDRARRIGKRGITKYFLYDLSNPIDAEIVQRIITQNSLNDSPGHQELFCRRILCHRLHCGTGNFSGADQVIESRLLQHCLKKGKTRNEMVRELFCIQFNIKTVDVGQPHNAQDLNLTEGVTCLN